MKEVQDVDQLTEFSIEQKKANIRKCVEDGVLDHAIAEGILKDLDRAMSRAGSTMSDLGDGLYLSTPVCRNEDEKEKNVREGKQWVKHYVQGVKGGYVLLKYSEGENKYSCYPPLAMVLKILEKGDEIKQALAEKAEKGHLFKTLATTRIEQLKPTPKETILG